MSRGVSSLGSSPTLFPPFFCFLFFCFPLLPLDGTGGWVSGWWTWKLKIWWGWRGWQCCHAAVLAERVFVWCCSPFPPSGRKECMSNAGCWCTKPRGKAWDRGKALQNCCTPQLVTLKQQQSQAPHSRHRTCHEFLATAEEIIPTKIIITNNISPLGGCNVYFVFFQQSVSVSVHTSALSFPSGTTDRRTGTSFHCLCRPSGGREGGSPLCRGFPSPASSPQPVCHTLSPLLSCHSRVAPPLLLVSGAQPENVVSGGQ